LSRRGLSPEGTTETVPSVGRPFGTIVTIKPTPNVETLGYWRMSLRDRDVAMFQQWVAFFKS
jgi:hypothetical protein